MKFNSKQTRKFSIDGVDQPEDSAFIGMSLSSETPCLRAFGNEILLHGTENIDMSRTMPNGLPLLVSHNDMELPIGRLKNIRLDSETRKLRGDAYFSGRPEAQAVRKDIEDGILTDISVGYRILDYKVEKSNTKDMPNNFMVTRWAPHEASLVAIGFDPAAGVGRSDSEEGSFEIPEDEIRKAPKAPVEDPEATVETPEATEDPVEEATETPEEEAVEEAVEDPVEEATETPEEEAIEEAIDPCCEACSETCDGSCCENCNKTKRAFKPKPELFSNEVLALRNTALKLNLRSAKEVDDILATNTLKEARILLLNSVPTITQQKDKQMEPKDFNLALTRAIANGIIGDFEMADELKPFFTQNGKRSFSVDLFTRANEMTATSAASAVYEQNIGFLELLKARTCVLAAGAKTKTGNGSMSYLRQTAALTATLRAENSGPVANSLIALDKVNYLPHALVAKVFITDELQKESIVDLQTKLRADMVSQFALAIDSYAISGNIAPSIAGLLKAGSGVQNGNLGAAAKPVFADIVHLKALVDTKAVNLDASAWILTPGLMGLLESTAKFTNGVAIADGQKINGYKAITSSNMPTSGVGGVNNSIIFGDFSNLEVCLQGPTEFMVDTQTRFDEGITILTARQYFDIGILQPTAFSKAENFLIA